MNKNGTKLYKQGQLNGYTYCIRQIFEENAIGYSHGSGNATKVNSKCHSFSSEEQNGKLGAPVPARLYTSPALVDGAHVVSGRKDQRRQRRAALTLPSEGKLRFADRLRALLKRENHQQAPQAGGVPQDPYDFSEAPAASAAVPGATVVAQRVPVATTAVGPAGIVPAPVVVSEVRRAVENGSHHGQVCAEPNHRPVQPRSTVVPKEVLIQQIQRVPVASQPLSSMSFAKGTTVFGLAEVKPKVAAAGGKPAVCSAASATTSAPPAAKLAKTMNRLQAKIAQNRVLDKLKRAQQDSGHVAPSSHNHRVVMVSSASPMQVGTAFARVDRQDTTKPATAATARPRERPSRDSRRVRAVPVTVAAPTAATTALATTPAAALHNLRRFWNADKNLGPEEASSGAPKLPGSQTSAELDSSCSDSSDDEDSTGERGPSLWNWDLDCSDASTVRSVRSLRIRRLRAELRKRYEVLCKRQAAARPALEKQDALVLHLARAARLCPNAAAKLLLGGDDGSNKPAKVETRPCCYQEDNGVCTDIALPYSRHCAHHITYNVDQMLYEHCTAKFADNTQCCVPVFDMCHELPLCLEHAQKRDNYNKMASEPKPKKPRKKSKPPALTRPPKRGKKKRAASSSLGLASPHTAPHSPSSSSFSSSCVPLEVLVQSPASSSSSSSPCSSRSPPFLGGSDSSSNLLLGSLVTAPTAAASPAPSTPQQQPPQPLLQAVAGCSAVRVKAEPKAPVVLHHHHHPPPPSCSSSSTSSSLAMPVLTSRPLPRPVAQAASSRILATTRTVPVHHTALPVVASPTTTAGHLGAATATMLPSVTHPSSSSSVRLVAGGTAATTRPVVVNHSHVVAQAVAHPSVAAMEAPTASVVGALAGTPITDGYGYVVTAGGMNAEAVAKELVERIEPDLASDLENQFSPDTIEKSLELPLDAAELANQATKLLEEHDFTEVLNKISDDAFSDLFSESKNGEYVPSKEETEELERALAAVSKDVHMARESLAKLSAAGGGAQGEVPDLPDLVDAFPDLPLSSSEINSLTQALMGGEAMRTVALLSSAADQGFTLLEQPPPHFGPPAGPPGSGVDATAAAPAATAPSAAGGWLLGAADFGSSSPAGPEVGPSQGGGGAVLPKRSVLAQESVS